MASRTYGLANAGDLMAGEVVHDDDVAGLEARGEKLFGVGLKSGAVHRPIQHHGRGQSAQAQAGDEGGCLPMSPGDRREQARAAPAAATEPGHVCLGAGLVNEDKTLGLEPGLPLAPVLTLSGNVGAILLRRPLGFFYSCNPARAAWC